MRRGPAAYREAQPRTDRVPLPVRLHAKVAGTEAGVVEPKATFSPCFGAPFMALSPTVYARLLGERIARHKADVWLVNTGWTGGPYGTGHRMPIKSLGQIAGAILGGVLFGSSVAVPFWLAGGLLLVLAPIFAWSGRHAHAPLRVRGAKGSLPCRKSEAR